jgi:hypothetical protein
MNMVRKLLVLMIITLFVFGAFAIGAGSALLVDSQAIASNTFTTGTFDH